MSTIVKVAIAGRRDVPVGRVIHLTEGSGTKPLIYPMWILESSDRITLVDTGFSKAVAAARHIVEHRETETLLQQAGIEGHDVSDVIISHLHYDHFGRTELFPNATFWIQRKDIDYFTGYGADHPAAKLADRDAMEQLDGLLAVNRVQVLDGGVSKAGQHTTVCVGGHTPGTQVTVVSGWGEPLVLACDASHLYENLLTRTPSSTIHSYDHFQIGFSTVEALAEGGRWFPGHDAVMLEELTQLTDDVYRLEARSSS
ncbi:MBL fold metallo-hydrolase [Cryobacterium sp. Y62]|uniref:MBL fold metallo-hydrolase n=1 Tax=Cryobacterium sp. Y62 TaxID=2048284 RepID=UPI000CE2C460|nr:MBL fold metallo-hydrolase [Cryobacterium sp. Y62]